MGLFSASPKKQVQRALRAELRARGAESLYSAALVDEVGKRLLAAARRQEQIDPHTLQYVILPGDIGPMVKRVIDSRRARGRPEPEAPTFAPNARADSWRAGFDDALNDRAPNAALFSDEPYHRGYKDGSAKRASA